MLARHLALVELELRLGERSVDPSGKEIYRVVPLDGYVESAYFHNRNNATWYKPKGEAPQLPSRREDPAREKKTLHARAQKIAWAEKNRVAKHPNLFLTDEEREALRYRAY